MWICTGIDAPDCMGHALRAKRRARARGWSAPKRASASAAHARVIVVRRSSSRCPVWRSRLPAAARATADRPGACSAPRTAWSGCALQDHPRGRLSEVENVDAAVYPLDEDLDRVDSQRPDDARPPGDTRVLGDHEPRVGGTELRRGHTLSTTTAHLRSSQLAARRFPARAPLPPKATLVPLDHQVRRSNPRPDAGFSSDFYLLVFTSCYSW